MGSFALYGSFDSVFTQQLSVLAAGNHEVASPPLQRTLAAGEALCLFGPQEPEGGAWKQLGAAPGQEAPHCTLAKSGNSCLPRAAQDPGKASQEQPPFIYYIHPRAGLLCGEVLDPAELSGFKNSAAAEVSIVLFTVITVLISIWMLMVSMRRKQPLPPGPWSLPVVGNLLQLGEYPYVSFHHMKKKYGDVFQIKLGMVPVVVVNGMEAIKQVLLRDGESFAGRPDMHTFSFFANGESMSFSVKYGESWKLQKKIASKALRSFAKSEANSSSCSCLLEEHVCAEASELVKTFMELSVKEGSFESFDPSAIITCAVANIVCALCFGKRYDHNDEEFLGVIKISHDFVEASGVFNPADFIPCLRYLPLPAAKAAREFYGKFNNFVARRVEDHYTTYDENHLRDITDALINVSNEKKADGKAAALSNEKIIITVNDIFGAGFGTVSSCLQWMFLYLISNPEIQTKIQEEIDGKIGLKPPRFGDRKDLHYTEAFINEIFRHTSFIPFTIPHCTTKDTTLNGYFIPQNTCIFINLYQVNHDETLWEDPYLFKPSRFLDENGEFNKSLAEKVLIFGMGIRKCLGEEVARNEVFVIITTVLQQLRLESLPEDKLDLTPIYGLSLAPKPYRIHAVPRT